MTPAIVEVGGRAVSWRVFNRRVAEVAAGLMARGVRRGDRVALLVPPSADLALSVYAVWRAGAVIVVADKGLGVRGMGRALRSARVDHVIGTAEGLAAARAMRLRPLGLRISAGAPYRMLGASVSLADLARAGRDRADLLPEPSGEDECAVVFTSGATGPAKGVVYRHRQLRAQVAADQGDLRPHRRGPDRGSVRPLRLVRPRSRHRLGGAGHGRHGARAR